MSTVSKRVRRSPILSALGLALIGIALVFAMGGRPAVGAPATGAHIRTARAAASPTVPSVTAKSELTTAKAVVLGLVEGITEFLPVSSTGHLHIAEQLMDVGKSPATKEAMDSYTVIIQVGAIAAVLLISWRRIIEVFQGLIGRSVQGRKLLVALAAAFVPAAAIGVVLDKAIGDHLLKTAPIAAAWIVGGVAIMVFGPKYRTARRGGRALESLTVREGAIIGVAQALALWPGVSRSLVTILAAIVIGLSLEAAVEFSFLLGLLTLGAATVYKLGKDGSLVFDTYGKTSPLIGIAVAFVSAAIAVKWMIAYLHRHDLTVFAGYRIIIGVAALGLMATTLL